MLNLPSQPEDPLVSVIIPLYNGGRYLEECLNSVIHQTYSNIEILVVDDGSTDNSSEIVKSFGDPRIKLSSQKNTGRCGARNVALRLARGEYVKYLDQDDVLDAQNISVQVAALSSENENVLCVGQLRTFDEDVRSSHPLSFMEAFPLVIDSIGFLTILAGNAVQSSVWLTPRSLHLEAGYWNEELPHNPMDDGELFMRILMKAGAVKYCKASIAYHRITPGERGSNHDNPIKIWSYFRSLELCSQHLLEREDSPRTRQICARWFKHCLYLHWDFSTDLRAAVLANLHDLASTNVPYYVGGTVFQAIDRVFGANLAFNIRHYFHRILRQWHTLFQSPR